jgi:hypothetical protein
MRCRNSREQQRPDTGALRAWPAHDRYSPIAVTRRMRSARQITAPSRAKQARRGSGCCSCLAEIGMRCSLRVAHHLSQLCRDLFGLDLDRFLPRARRPPCRAAPPSRSAAARGCASAIAWASTSCARSRPCCPPDGASSLVDRSTARGEDARAVSRASRLTAGSRASVSHRAPLVAPIPPLAAMLWCQRSNRGFT